MPRLATMVSVGAVLASYLVGLAPGAAPASETAAEPARPRAPAVTQKRIPFGAKRKADMRRYAKRHYGIDDYRLDEPQVIVEHFTVTDSFAATFNIFAPNRPDPSFRELPNTCAHYVIDRDGRIYQLVSRSIMCRHTVGLNWTAIGIEHVGRSDRDVMRNDRQRRSSLALTRWLQDRYDIRTRNVIGHAESLSSPFHRERVDRFKGQTHADFSHETMRDYRKQLTRLPKPAPGAAHAAGSRGASALRPIQARRELLGRSVEGRAITATRRGDPDSPTKVLVIGCMHGNECAGTAVTAALRSGHSPPVLDLWIVDDLNPDGRRRGTRQNARGVDLNRNFDYRWRRQGKPGSKNHSGSGVLSEPESRIAERLIRRIRPDLTVWYHQALELVDESGGDPDLERRYAKLVGLPFERLERLPGSATSWQNEAFPGTTSFVVELAGGALSRATAERHARAVLKVARP